MEKFQFNKVVKGKEIKDMVEKELGSTYRYELKETNRPWNNIKIMQDRFRGCIINYREKNGKTICTVIPRAPSLGLVMLIVVSPFILLELILIVFFGLVEVGIVTMLILVFVLPQILIFIMNRKSHDLFQRVVSIIKNSKHNEN
jgi:hypothetical protein